MSDKTAVAHTDEGKPKSLETRILNVTAELLVRKWRVLVGIGIVFIIIVGIITGISASKRRAIASGQKAFASAGTVEEYLEVFQTHRKTPAGALALSEAARLSLEKRDLAKAAELSETFLKEYPKHELAVFIKRNLGLIEESRGDFDKAIVRYREIIETDPNGESIADRLNLDIGRCYEELGDYIQAKSFYEKVSALPVRGDPNPRLRNSPWTVEAFQAITRVDRKIRQKTAEEAEEITPEPAKVSPIDPGI